MTKKITQDLLDFWLRNEKNVLFIGKHGTGKTSMIKECFDRNKLVWKYFSAATLDPWIDMVGVPKIVPNEDGEGQHIEMVLPSFFSDGSIEAIFVDEFNRGPKKVTNAVMELIQFKSINGHKFPNLKVVWAAINPKAENDKEEAYHVEALDPAIEDRFHIHVEVPYQPDMAYFGKKYGQNGRNAVDWWKEASTDVQNEISPRRLEYVLQLLEQDGDVSYALSSKVNVKQFLETIANGSLLLTAENFVKNGKVSDAKHWLLNPNNSGAILPHLLKKKNFMEFFTPLLPSELLTQQIMKNRSIRKYVLEQEVNNSDTYSPILNSIIDSGQNTAVIRNIKKNRSVKPVKQPEGTDFSKITRKIKKEYYTYKRWQLFDSMINIDFSNPLLTTKENALALYDAMVFLLERSRPNTIASKNSDLVFAASTISSMQVSQTDILNYGNTFTSLKQDTMNTLRSLNLL